MSDSMHILLSGLGEQLGLSHIPYSANDGCALDFDGELHVEIRHVERADAVNLVLELGTLPDAGAGDWMRWLAAANLDPALLDQGQFALDTNTGGLYLCRTLDAQGLAVSGLMAALRGLVTVGRTFRSSLAQPLRVQAA
jgi:hypothetical protein